MIPTQAGHNRKLFAQLVCVLGIEAGSRFLRRFASCIRRCTQWIESLIIIIVVKRCADTDIVMLIDIRFKHQLCIAVLLSYIISGHTEDVVRIVPRAMHHQGYRCVMVAVKCEAVFPLHLIAVGLDRGGVWKFRRIRICVFQALSAFVLIMQGAHHQLAYPPRRHIRPSVHYIVLSQLRHINKSVVIAIVVINSGLFAATDIQIQGSEHVTKHDAIQLIDLPEGTSLFNVDPDQITEDLKQNPWVSGVDVQRQFPHTLIITPTERKVVAIAYISSDDLAWAIGDDDTWIAPLSTSVEVDDQGNVITTGQGSNTLTGIDAALALAKHYGAVLLTDVSADVAPVSGQAVSSKAVKAGLDYVRGFSSEFLGQVKDISTPSVEAISANLNNGIEVSLGDSDDIAKKERIVTKLLSQVEGVTYINVRSPGNYTFRNAPTS